MRMKCCGYNIIFGEKIFEDFDKFIDLSKYSKVIILTEKKIYNLWKNKIDSTIRYNKLIQIDSGERMKNFDTTKTILTEMIDSGTDRKSLLINIGGGMITDLGGFVASIYMRGVDYINCPTTLLSMVDASIGGKNGVNLDNTKNIIGCFGHPKMVLIDIEFLQTLERRELMSAYGEIIKHSIIFDKNYFNILTEYANNNKCIEKIESGSLLTVIQKSLKIKKHIVEKDFKEKNIRQLLNFGHTIGHAIEALSLNTDNHILHGEAVIVGMIVESKIAVKMGLLSNNEQEKIKNLIKKYGFESLINRKFNFQLNEMMQIMRKDKKNQNGEIKMVLPTKVGKCKYDICVKPEIIQDCLKGILE